MTHQRVFAVLSVSIALSACAGIGKAPSQAPTGRETSRRNPFLDVNFFLNPEYVASVRGNGQGVSCGGGCHSQGRAVPHRFVAGLHCPCSQSSLVARRGEKQQQASGKPTLSLVIVYDMPNRDCAANSSAGELKSRRTARPATEPSSSTSSPNTSRTFPSYPSW